MPKPKGPSRANARSYGTRRARSPVLDNLKSEVKGGDLADATDTLAPNCLRKALQTLTKVEAQEVMAWAERNEDKALSAICAVVMVVSMRQSAIVHAKDPRKIRREGATR